MATGRARRRPLRGPIGAVWRIRAWSPRGAKRFALDSADYPEAPAHPEERVAYRTILDEVVLAFPGGSIHLEQMDTRTWYLGIGDQKVMITIDREGRPVMGPWYR